MTGATALRRDEQADAVLRDSRLSRDLAALLADDGVTCVSFDVFDTLLRRRVGRPEAVFDAAAERAAAEDPALPFEPQEYRFIRIEAENRARKACADPEIAFETIFDHMPFDEALRARLRDHERSVEMETVYADPHGLSLLHMAQDGDKPVIFISDMYHSPAFIAALIRKATGVETHGRLYVSSEYCATKHRGDLFDHVLAARGLAARQLAHIGDNYVADVLSAKARGVRSLHFNAGHYERALWMREASQGVSLPPALQQARLSAALTAPPAADKAAAFFYGLGAVYAGPILSGLARWAVDVCVRQGVGVLLCHMREGALISACVRRELARRPDVRLRVVLCYTSRQSTWWASLHEEAPEKALDKLIERRFYTFADLRRELEIDIGGWAPEQRLSDFRDDPSGAAGLAFRAWGLENWPRFDAHIRSERRKLDAYIAGLTGGDDFATLEYSCRGTTQDQLRRALTRPARLNLLFAAGLNAYEKAPDMALTSFLPLTDETRKIVEALDRTGDVMDALLTGTRGSTVGYRTNATGRVEPVLAPYPIPETQKARLAALEQGVAAYQAVQPAFDVAPPSRETRLSFARMMARLLVNPTPEEAHFIGGMEYFDSFGGSYPIVSDAMKAYVAGMGAAEFWRAYCNNISFAFEEVRWPGGALTQIDPGFISEMHLLRRASDKFAEAIARLISHLRRDEVRRAVVYGAGEFFSLLLPELRALDIEIVALVDAKAAQGAYRVGDFTVTTIQALDKAPGMDIVIASASFIDPIKKNIAEAFGGTPVRVYSV
jgi:FMN phosphatase YigB (HAD superfamily)